VLTLERNERVLYAFSDVAYYTVRTRTQSVGGSQGLSVRLTRGVYYRTGSFKGEPIRTQQQQHEGTAPWSSATVTFILLARTRR
jgi:hypothetical protein